MRSTSVCSIIAILTITGCDSPPTPDSPAGGSSATAHEAGTGALPSAGTASEAGASGLPQAGDGAATAGATPPTAGAAAGAPEPAGGAGGTLAGTGATDAKLLWSQTVTEHSTNSQSIGEVAGYEHYILLVWVSDSAGQCDIAPFLGHDMPVPPNLDQPLVRRIDADESVAAASAAECLLAKRAGPDTAVFVATALAGQGCDPSVDKYCWIVAGTGGVAPPFEATKILYFEQEVRALSIRLGNPSEYMVEATWRAYGY